jgi:hypothetical protein
MEATAQSQLQRAELDAVLAAGIFNRAPNLASFLRYVCEQHFEGGADQIKEYNIAVEALGRGAHFDQKKDSIVRVEAHRLRKRLAEYYSGPGANHFIHIEIPNGQYAPRFVEKPPTILEEHKAVWAEEVPTTEALTQPEILPKLRDVEPFQRVHSPRNRIIGIIAVALVLTVVILWIGRRQRAATIAAASETWSGDSTNPVSGEFRMLAGYRGAPFTDRQGHTWSSDAYFTGGRSVPLSPLAAIEGLPDPDLPKTMREGTFRYEIPLRPGTYELHLYFAETNPTKREGAEGDEVRAFQVRINGETVLDLFDILSEAGAPNRLQVRVFKDIGPAKDGKLHLEFSGQNGQPILNGIEILSSLPGRIRPIRIVAHKSPVTDAEGRVWAADEFVVGGHLVERSTSVLTLGQKNLFEGERFGNFAYRLPVTPGKYRLTLRFAETYFGSDIPNSPPFRVGARVFNVFANGVAILRNFDVGEAAGGPNRGVVQSFDNLEPNAQGLIVVEFSPLRNYACVNAIELEETN